jgi:hypothetical protein
MIRITRALVIHVVAAAATATLAAAQPPLWTLREELRMGAAPGPADDLANISGVAISKTGMAWVFQGGRSLVSFTPALVAARHATTSGHVRFGWLGDTLWVVDVPRVAFALLDPAGSVVRRIPYAHDPEFESRPPIALGDGITMRRVRPFDDNQPILALLADGSILRAMDVPDASDTIPSATLRVIPGPVRADTSVRTTGFLVRAGQDGRIIEGLEVFSTPWSDARIPSPYGHVARVPQPFQDHQLVALTPDGSEIVMVERFAAPRPGPWAYSVARFDLRSRKRTAHRFEYEPVPVTAAAVDSAVARLMDGSRGAISTTFLQAFPSPGAAGIALRAAIRRPAYHTPVTDVVVGSDRTVWLRASATGQWLAHSPSGSIVGRLSLPAASRLLAADAEHVWAASPMSAGPPGSEVLIRYRILRP